MAIDGELVVWVARNRYQSEAIALGSLNLNDRQSGGRTVGKTTLSIDERRVCSGHKTGLGCNCVVPVEEALSLV